jgi:hypothetical protein
MPLEMVAPNKGEWMRSPRKFGEDEIQVEFPNVSPDIRSSAEELFNSFINDLLKNPGGYL